MPGPNDLISDWREARDALAGQQEHKVSATPTIVSRPMSETRTGGLRDNVGKPPMSLCPMSLIKAVALVIWRSSKEGGGKYPMANWARGLSYRETADCALRHLYKWLEGEEYDQESGLHHLEHLACNVAFLVEFRTRGTGVDDRVKLSTINAQEVK